MQLTLVRQPAMIVPSRRGGVRPIRPDDLETLAGVLRASHPAEAPGGHDEAVADLGRVVAGESGEWVPEGSLVATADGEIVGAILVTNEPPWEGVAHLNVVGCLFVAPAARRRGVGEALLRGALRALPHRAVGIRVDSENSAARALCDKLGFRPI